MPTLTLSQTQKELKTKTDELASIFDKADTGQKDDAGQTMFDLVKAGVTHEEIKKRNDELTELGKQRDGLRETDEAFKAMQLRIRQDGQTTSQFGGGAQEQDTDGTDSAPETRPFEKAFTASAGYKSWKDNPKQIMSVKIEGSVKTLLQTSAGYLPPTLQDTRVVLSPQRKPVVADLIPQDDTKQQFIPYIVETTFTNTAAAVGEGLTKPEAALAYTRKVAQMQKIAVTLPVTQEQMMYIASIESLLKNRLGLMVLLEEDRELLNGSGTSPEMTGFLNTVGIQNQPQGSDDVFTAHYKAITKVRATVGFADPTGLVIHPNNWLTMRTVKDSVGRFILGDPDQVGPERIWGLPVIATIAEPLGTSLLGDFQQYSHIDRAMELVIGTGYINNDYINNIVRLLAEEFLALEIYRGSAFCTVSGLA